MQDSAQRGAEAALKMVGLEDQYAGEDIRNLRALLKSWRRVKKGFWQTILEMVGKASAIVVLSLLLAGIAAKLGVPVGALFGGNHGQHGVPAP